MTIRLTDKAVEREIFFNPELKAAEAYMDGRLVMENGGTVSSTCCRCSRSTGRASPRIRCRRRCARSGGRFRRSQQNNALGLAAENVRHHYDIPTEIL